MPYSQFTAMMAIARASFRSITRSPSAVVFTLLFPLIFIVVFGFLGGSSLNLDLGIAPGCDRNNPIFQLLPTLPGVSLTEIKDEKTLNDKLEKGRIDASLKIIENLDPTGPRYRLEIETSAAAPEKAAVLRSMLDNLVMHLNIGELPESVRLAGVESKVSQGKKYQPIDFILPGQLGFSILSSGVFGTAFVFFSLRQTLVLKRFFATPIQRPYIILGEAMSRLVFALTGALFIITIGHFAFDFTLVNGMQTVLIMLMLSALGLIAFMGFGFIISGLAKSESVIPPLANIVTLPQFLLSGTFFPIDAFPSWLQPFCKILPLTFLNDALRQVAFEGAGFADIALDLGALLAWTVVIYLAAVKLFRWE